MKTKIKAIITFLVFTITPMLHASSIHPRMAVSQCKQYEKVEIDIELKQKFENPYRQEEIALDVIFQTPSGNRLTLPCFFVSRTSKDISYWKARFSPSERGEYKCHVEMRKNGKRRDTSSSLSFNVLQSSNNGFLHPKSNWVLQFDNGKPFRGIGQNFCWESRKSDDSKYSDKLHEDASRYNYDYLLTEFSKFGGNFFRTWICSWNLPFDYKGPFNNTRYEQSDEYYNPDALARLDYLLELSEKLNLYIMLTLGQGGYTTRDHGVVNNAEEFFAKKEARDWYKNRLRYIVARWGYSTSIAMWEFFNEVDNVQYANKDKPIDGKIISDWHDDMSTYLRSIDPYHHIITTSISHRDVTGLNSIKNIDINQRHIYNYTSTIPSVIEDYVTRYNKPYIIGEFGREWDWTKNFNEFADEMDIDFKRGLWYGLFSPTPVTPMSWWWEYFDSRGMTPYFRAVREISDRMLNDGNGNFEKIPINAENVQAFCVKCGEEIFLYMFNPEIQTFMSNVKIPIPTNHKFEITSLDPTMLVSRQVKEVEHTDKEVVINDVILGTGKEILYILSPAERQ